MNKWGVPDWKDEAAYPKSRTDIDWRWQFLRRNHDYRAEWKKFAPRAKANVEKEKALWESFTGRKAEENGEFYSTYFETAPTDDPDSCLKRFGVAVLLDPRKEFDVSHLNRRFRSTFAYFQGFKKEDQLRRDYENGRVLMGFDLNKAIPRQIELAKLNLLRFQKVRLGKVLREDHLQKSTTPKKMEKGKDSHDLWPTYLRALDAKDARASYKKMAEEFWKDDSKKTPQSARDTFERAKQLSDNPPR
jgi:hypothetical protein